MVQRSLMVRVVVGSILHDGAIELFVVPTSAPLLLIGKSSPCLIVIAAVVIIVVIIK